MRLRDGPRFLGAALTLGSVLACGGGRETLAPSSPEAAVRTFMNAVRANSLSTMGELWGSARGPARSYMPAGELEQRLIVIRTYLEHESFEILEPQSALPRAPNQRIVEVRLTRKGCRPVVPFTLIPYKGGWLISNIDIAAAGNPARSCPQVPGPSLGEPGAQGTGLLGEFQ
jgi:hypothetical protein